VKSGVVGVDAMQRGVGQRLIDRGTEPAKGSAVDLKPCQVDRTGTAGDAF
jgi:hypothetical protein